MLACCGGLLYGARSADAEPDAAADTPSLARRLIDYLDRSASSRCLTPAAGSALSDLIAAGGLQPALQDEFTFVNGVVGGQQIELEVRDRAHHSYSVTLAIPGSKDRTPDGQGRRFLFYLTASGEPANPRARAALLAAAALFDAAIPDTALAPCAGGDELHTDRRYPRAVALASAVAEVSIIIAAIVYGLFAIRPRRAGVSRRV